MVTINLRFTLSRKGAPDTEGYRNKINQQSDKPADKPFQVSDSIFQIGRP
jgi:hypothetical protein